MRMEGGVLDSVLKGGCLYVIDISNKYIHKYIRMAIVRDEMEA